MVPMILVDSGGASFKFSSGVRALGFPFFDLYFSKIPGPGFSILIYASSL